MSRFEETRIRGHFTGEETEAVEMGRHLSQRGSGRVRMRRRTCSPRHFFFFPSDSQQIFPGGPGARCCAEWHDAQGHEELALPSRNM